MSQYKTGTVTVTNASATVTGSGTLWTANVTVGSLFTIIGSSVPYVVGAVASNTSLTLTALYAGGTLAAQNYSITTSYTPLHGIPYMERSDIETQTIFKRAMILIENLIASLTQIQPPLLTTGGTSTAYTLTPDPVIGAYTAGLSFFVNFHTASGAAPTIQISGLATPPNLVKKLASGAFSNIAASDLITNDRSRVVLLSTTQAWVEDVRVGIVSQGLLVNSAGLLAALSDETGTGLAVFNAAPTFTGQVACALGTASAPSRTFTGDLNNGIYSAGADLLNFTTAGVLAVQIGATGRLSTIAGSATTPALAFTADLDTGIWNSATDSLSIATVGVTRLSVNAATDVTSTLPIVHPAGTESAPSITFAGDLNTGIYSLSADNMSLTTGGVTRVSVGSVSISVALPVILQAGSQSVPSLIFTGDTNTGIYNPGADKIGIATGGVLRAQVSNTGVKINGALNYRYEIGTCFTYNPVSLASQTMLKAAVIAASTVQAGLMVPPSALSSDLIAFGACEGASEFGLHSVAAIDDGARVWKNILVAGALLNPNEGFMHGGTIATDPPSIADQTLWTTTFAQSQRMVDAGLDGNDLLILSPLSTLEATLAAAPAYLFGTSIRFSLHTTTTTDGASLSHNYYILKAPPTITVNITPAALLAQIAARTLISLPAGSCNPGDFIGVIPPSDLEADIIYIGCHCTATDTVALGVHSIGAVASPAARDWKFVVLPGVFAN